MTNDQHFLVDEGPQLQREVELLNDWIVFLSWHFQEAQGYLSFQGPHRV